MLNVSFSIETFIMIHFNLEMMLVYCLNTYHCYSKMNQKKVKIVIGYKLFVIFVHVDLWKTLNKKLVNSFKIAIFKNLFHSHTINFHCCSQLVWILQNSIYVLEGYSLVVHVCRILNLWGLGAL